ncbi:hypothetical protein OH146_05240 [Salinibacterium sp. SYSU T00001]|uniref:hypothetical protein n=1 Tax=Homoserinimonas sedimenticola TaxID=2986805 RepID=UPI002235EAD6|nr:hypothetical protein [Salinibacterium sedimenticola]MCW4385176.1 hypothetical protein [Salinibacterium sedimenticola]
MRPPERTRQELDPVGAFSTRSITIGAALVAFIFAATMVVASIDIIANSGLALLALLGLGMASVLVTSATDPYRGPFHRGLHGWVIALSIVATALLAAATWDTPVSFVIGWVGPVCLGLFSVGMSAYRPVREIIAYGSLAAVFMGFISMLQAQSNPVAGVPVPAVVGIHLLPLLALNFSAAAFTGSMIEAVERWRSRANEAVDRMSEEQESGIARSVQQDRVTILNREVVPFFTDALAGQELTPEVRARARSIADAIRSVMVAEVDRTWLENLVDHLRARVRRYGEIPDSSRVVFDDDHVANLMTYDQRTALRALLVAIFDQADNRPQGLEIVIVRAGERCQGFVAVEIDMVDSLVKSRFGPYLAVMRVVFRRLRAEHLQSVLTVRFSYDQR